MNEELDFALHKVFAVMAPMQAVQPLRRRRPAAVRIVYPVDSAIT